MADLSPAARKILISYWTYPTPEPTDSQKVAAALRAVADLSIFADIAVDQTEKVVLVSDLLAIADELNPPEPHLAAPLSRL